MKKLSIILIFFLIGCVHLQKKPISYEEIRALSQKSLDSKVTALSENTDPLLTDLLYWIDDPTGTPASNKIEWGTLLDDTKGNGDTAYAWSADKIYDQLALKQDLDSDLSTLASPTAWRVFYSDGSSVITELTLGTSGQYLKSNGLSSAPSWSTPSGAGDMLKSTYDNDEDGDIDQSAGGLEADVSGYTGLIGLNSGAVTEVDTAAELETFAGLGAFFNEYADDADAGAMRTTLGLEIGTDIQAYSAALQSIIGLTEADVSVLETTADNAYNVVTSGGNNYILGSNSDNSALEFKTIASIFDVAGIMTTGDNYTNFSGSASDDTPDEFMAAIDTAFGLRCLKSVFGTALEADDLELSGTTLQLAAEIPHTDVAETLTVAWDLAGSDADSCTGIPHDADFSTQSALMWTGASPGTYASSTSFGFNLTQYYTVMGDGSNHAAATAPATALGNMESQRGDVDWTDYFTTGTTGGSADIDCENTPTGYYSYKLIDNVCFIDLKVACDDVGASADGVLKLQLPYTYHNGTLNQILMSQIVEDNGTKSAGRYYIGPNTNAIAFGKVITGSGGFTTTDDQGWAVWANFSYRVNE